MRVYAQDAGKKRPFRYGSDNQLVAGKTACKDAQVDR